MHIHELWSEDQERFFLEQKTPEHASIILSWVHTLLLTSCEHSFWGVMKVKKIIVPHLMFFRKPKIALISSFLSWHASQYHGAPEADQNDEILHNFTKTYLKHPSRLCVFPMLHIFGLA